MVGLTVVFFGGVAIGLGIGVLLGAVLARSERSRSQRSQVVRPGDVLSTVQAEAWEWTKLNFPRQVPWHPFVGIVEELGELSHGYLKATQGIRGTSDEHMADMEDAVGDMMIFLCNWCSYMNIDVSDALRNTWEHVKTRNWQINPQSGIANVEANINVGVER